MPRAHFQEYALGWVHFQGETLMVKALLFLFLDIQANQATHTNLMPLHPMLKILPVDIREASTFYSAMVLSGSSPIPSMMILG
jgi:hypothetical protein